MGKTTLTGLVSTGLINIGSKSEHKAIFIKQKSGRKLELQSVGGNPFQIDAVEKKLIGKTVKVRGAFTPSGSIFRFTDVLATQQPKKA